MNYKKPIAVLACIITLCTSACIRSPHIYRLDIDQGNNLSNELVCQLKVGMTPDEVRDLLGTPMLDAIFRKDRWYYMYYRQPGHGKSKCHYLIVQFKDGVVSEFKQDYCCP